MKPTLSLSCGEYARTRPLLDGRVHPQGYPIRVVSDPFPAEGILADYQHARNQRMIVDRAFDICELGMAPYLSARAAGVPLIAIPVFHYRRFRHSYIFFREQSGIRYPKDLAGRRVGVRRLNLSAGVWARGLLQHEYGLALNQITWVVALDVPLRPEVRDELKVERAPADESLETLLLRGELDAMIEASVSPLIVRSRGIRPLLGEDTRQLEVDYYTRTGIFPVMHTVVLWQETASRLPGLAHSLHKAFVEAKAVAAREPEVPLRYVLGLEERQWWNSLTETQRQAMQKNERGRPRDPWIYSVREDRKTIETFLYYADEQGLTPERYRIEDLFVSSILEV